MGPPTILVVDDEFLIAEIVCYALEDEGCDVRCAADGRRALALLDAEPAFRPAVVVTDFMMPAMNGLELAQAIRGRPALARVPIVLMSGAQADIGRREKDIFAAVFDKPFRLEELVRTVMSLVSAPPPT
ncbi:response regulator [Rhizosaccharibacter radicis]|uniref:Response regulator n=1 Tax=Rhizosaccharibacter radicis TaxID=2782605 RepID=A0ABT1W0D0_9PROT|nr:response regulator [Acetobacteraceae bacterium KSS12]